MDSHASSRRRAYWLKTLHQWHWISSALCLLCMVLFAATGLIMNNASLLTSKALVTNSQAHLPQAMLAQLATWAADAKKAPLPLAVAQWLDQELDASTCGKLAEWSADEVYLSLPRAGGDAWLLIDRTSGAIEYERTDRGWIAYLNDLHKGRNTGPAWSWFIDFFALACLVFALTGLVLLKMHASRRGATWPMVGLGVVIPLVLALLSIH